MIVISHERFMSFLRLAKAGGLCGILLLSRPLLYAIFSRQRDLSAYSSVDASAIVFILYAVVCFYFPFEKLTNKTLYLLTNY